MCRSIIFCFLFFIPAVCSASIELKPDTDKYLQGIFQTSLEYKLFDQVLRKIELRKRLDNLQQKACGELPQSYSGQFGFKGLEYKYLAELGRIDVWSEYATYTFFPQQVFEAVGVELARRQNIDNDDVINEQAIWPIVPAVVILVDHIACQASQASAVTYCNAVCNCGVLRYSFSCVLGRISTTCECFECPQQPNILSSYPINGNWGGALLQGIPMFFNPGSALEVGAPYSYQP